MRIAILIIAGLLLWGGGLFAYDERGIEIYKAIYKKAPDNQPPWVKIARKTPGDEQETTTESQEKDSAPKVDEGVRKEPSEYYYLAPDGTLMVWDREKHEYKRSN